MSLLSQVRHGSRVTIVDRFGVERTGTANGLLITRGSHCVLNMGGKHGRPAVADDRNIVSVYNKPERSIREALKSERSSERAAEASWLEGMGV